jgi:CheY-like chemotaxis protein
MTRGPILIVEDDPVIRDLLLDLLDIEGYPAIAAADGVEALRQIQRVHPSLILLDLNLPRMDGESVLKELAKAPRPIPPILLITADPRGRRLRHMRGIIGFLSKPFNIDDLLQAIEDARSNPRRPQLG